MIEGAALALLLAALFWALRDLERFVLVAVLGAMIIPATLIQPGGTQVASVDVLIILALGVWLIALSARAVPVPWLAGNRLLAPTVLFLAVNIASLAWSVEPRDTVVRTIQMLEIVVLVPLIFASLPKSIAAIRTGMFTYIGVTTVLAAVTVVAFLLDAASGNYAAQYLPGLHKNANGSFLAAGLVLSFTFWLGEDRHRVRAALGLIALVEFAGLLTTVSRGAIAGAMLAVLLVCILLQRGRLLTFSLAAVTLTAVATGAIVPPEPKSLLPGGYASSEVRRYSFDHAVEKISDRPMLGTGAGTYEDYLLDLDNSYLPDPNNMFLLTWAELGIGGMAALLFLLWRFGRLWVAARRLPTKAGVPAVAAGGVTLSLLVHFQVDVTWIRGSATLAFAMMGLLLAASRLAPAKAQSPERSSETLAVRPAGPRPRPPPRPVRRSDPMGRADCGGPLRVLHVVTSDAFAGIERHVIRLTRDLRKLGCAAELACPPSAARVRLEAAAVGVPVHPPDDRPSRTWLGGVARQVASKPPDVIHLHDGRSAVAGALLAPLARSLVVRTQHFTRPASVERSGWRRRASLALHPALNRNLDGYIAVSQCVLDGAQERDETGSAELIVISPGIEVPEDDTVAQARRSREQVEHPVVAYIGRLEVEKRLEILLQAIPGVRQRLPDCEFIIAGSGAARGDLHALAKRLGLDASVTWKGEVAHPDSVLEETHVYVNPWPWEGFGLAMAEAMAYGLPVIAVNSGASPELVNDGVTGLLVPAADSVAFAAAIVQLAGDRPEASRMGGAARRHATERYGAARTARETLAFYRRLQAGERM